LFIEESYIYEYKNYWFPIEEEEFVFRIKKAVCSFLNSPRGGIIFFGIDDDSEIKGV
jgi:predicted HTH transcriptional regulator